MYVLLENRDNTPFIAEVNTLFCETLEYERDELLGTSLLHYLTPTSRTAMLEGVFAHALIHNTANQPTDFITKMGRVIPTIAEYSAYRDANGNVTGVHAHYIKSIIDIQVLERLAATLGPVEGKRMVRHIVELFVEELPQQYRTIESAVLSSHWVKVHQAAHTLKGSSSTIGATALAELCVTLEQHAQQEEGARLSDLIPLFHATTCLTAQALQAWLK